MSPESLLQEPFYAPWSVWEGHTCPVGGPVTVKDWASHYVKSLLDRGYTVEKANAEIGMGSGHACEPGYEISHGTLYVGGRYGTAKKGDARVFRFAELAGEITEVPTQTNLFSVAA